MASSNSLFLIFLLTIVLLRLILFMAPIPGPTIGGFRVHHYLIGVIAVAVSLLTRWPLGYAVGLGLLIDEATYVLIGGTTHADNYSALSLVGTAALVVLTFAVRDVVFRPVL